MAYIPLNKIVTNIITDGNEYQFPNGQIYRGFYWKNYKGEFFTGKTPNDSPTLQIFPISNQTNPGDTPLPFTQMLHYIMKYGRHMKVLTVLRKI